MKTTEMETIYDLGTKMIEAVQKEKVGFRRRVVGGWIGGVQKKVVDGLSVRISKQSMSPATHVLNPLQASCCAASASQRITIVDWCVCNVLTDGLLLLLADVFELLSLACR